MCNPVFWYFSVFCTEHIFNFACFFISYIIFSICIGLTAPVWLNFLVKIFSILLTMAFYANYATQYFDIKAYTAAGLFVGFIYTDDKPSYKK